MPTVVVRGTNMLGDISVRGPKQPSVLEAARSLSPSWTNSSHRPAYEWKRLSPNFRTLRRLTTLIFVPIVFIIPAVLVWVLSDLWWISAIILVFRRG